MRLPVCSVTPVVIVLLLPGREVGWFGPAAYDRSGTLSASGEAEGTWRRGAVRRSGPKGPLPGRTRGRSGYGLLPMGSHKPSSDRAGSQGGMPHPEQFLQAVASQLVEFRDDSAQAFALRPDRADLPLLLPQPLRRPARCQKSDGVVQ